MPFGVRWSGEEASGVRGWFVRQDCCLSPYLCRAFMDGVVWTGGDEDTRGTCSRSNNTCVIFADDLKIGQFSTNSLQN